MQLGGPTVVPDFHIPSSGGTFRLDDLVAVNDEVFVGFKFQGPIASQYSHVQLKNPGGSGVTVLLDHLFVGTQSQAGWVYHVYDTDLAVDVGAGISLRAAGNAALAHVRSGTNVARLGSFRFTAGAVLTSEATVFPMRFPFVLSPGEGLALITYVVNDTITVMFGWREI